MLLLQYYEKLGKPRPKIEVMNYMKSKDYVDAKDYAGECEPIVMLTKGQSKLLKLILFFKITFKTLLLYQFTSVQILMRVLKPDVQGTCKYGTRVDYILSSPNSPYKYVPGSYSVISSKGTSDHHIVKVDLMKVTNSEAAHENVMRRCRNLRQKVKRIAPPCSATSVWELTPPPKVLVPKEKKKIL